MLVLAGVAATAGATTAAPAVEEPPAASASRFLEAHQTMDGGFAEDGRQADAELTAWAALGLAAGGGSADARDKALGYLRAHEGELRGATALALHVLARAALGERDASALARLRAATSASMPVNGTIWTILALRGLGEPAPTSLVRRLLAAQARSGGWSWANGVAPDSNDTAAAVQALRAAAVGGRPLERALAFMARHRRPDGGFSLTVGRASDAQSTAWAIQAYLAARRPPPAAAYRFLARLRRADGSYRYSAAYATTPVWVTAQVVPALARRPFPLT